MAKTYHFRAGYIQISKQISPKYCIHNILYLLLLTFIFLIVFVFTDHIFSATISTENYYEIISLGAVFATIGSSVISITSLSCGYYFEEYKKANEILLSYDNESKNTNTWNFIEDNKVILKSAKHTIAYKKFFSEIVFEFGMSTLPIPIATNKKELIFWKLIKSKRLISGCTKNFPEPHCQDSGMLTFYSALLLHCSWTISFQGASFASSSSDISLLGRCSSRYFRYSYKFRL